jgi:hypothetical protein
MVSYRYGLVRCLNKKQVTSNFEVELSETDDGAYGYVMLYYLPFLNEADIPTTTPDGYLNLLSYFGSNEQYIKEKGLVADDDFDPRDYTSFSFAWGDLNKNTSTFTKPVILNRKLNNEYTEIQEINDGSFKYYEQPCILLDINKKDL